MDTFDRNRTAELINFIWGPGTISPNQVNSHVVLLVYKALHETKTCSDAMDWVPRPPTGPTNLSWAVKQLRKAAKRMLSRKDREVYNICKVGVASIYREPLVMAIMGVD